MTFEKLLILVLDLIDKLIEISIVGSKVFKDFTPRIN